MRGLVKVALWVALILLIALVITNWVLVAYVFDVPQNDMVPNIAMGDSFVVYKHGTPEIGDVLVCTHPRRPGNLMAGRLVGKAGDTVEIRRGMLLLNGRQLDTEVPTPAEFRLIDRTVPRTLDLMQRREILGDDSWVVSYQQTRQPLEVTPRTVRHGFFLLADNRSYGTDSRDLGEFEPSDCPGVAVFVLSTGEGNGDLDQMADERRFALIQ